MSRREKKRIVQGPMRKDPRYTATNSSLQFDNFDEPVIISDEEKAALFISEYNHHVDPFVRWERYWKNTAFDYSVTLAKIKQFYTKLVLSGNWDENKFVHVTNEIFEQDMTFTETVYDIFSKKYENEEIGPNVKKRGARHQRRRTGQ